MQYTQENIKQGICAKIDKLYDDNTDREFWKQKLLEYPKEIEQNILEWINDHPITDVDCHGESILDKMNAWKMDISYFPMVVRGFIQFSKTQFTCPSVIDDFMLTEDLI